jgi:antitoxin (DNA-binding transcriptional repressor) of toxin-antitoxin stability system
MKRVRVAEFKAKLSEHLRSVRRGNDLAIYDRDQPIALVVPWKSSEPLRIREPAGRYKSLKFVPLPPPLELPMDVVDLLLEDRARE